MASINHASIRQHWSGRDFASADPERQREVAGYVSGSIETAPASRATTERAARKARLDWMRVQPERDLNNFEGSSSRRGR